MMEMKTSLRATLIKMEPGAEVVLPLGVRSYAAVRNTASTLGLEYGRKYKVHADRVASTYTITRVS